MFLLSSQYIGDSHYDFDITQLVWELNSQAVAR